MKLYEIDPAIEALVAMLEPDPETGELIADFEWVCEQIEALAGEKESKLKGIALAYLEAKANAAAAKAEKQRLATIQAVAENKARRLLATMDFFAKGEKIDLGVAKVSYRKSNSLQIEDTGKAVDWLTAHGYGDYITYSAPTIAKTDVKKLITSGNEVPGCSVVESVTCSIK